MSFSSSLGLGVLHASQTEHSRFWKCQYVLIAICGLLFIACAVLLGIPNRPTTLSLAGYESRLLFPNTVTHGFVLVSGTLIDRPKCGQTALRRARGILNFGDSKPSRTSLLTPSTDPFALFSTDPEGGLNSFVLSHPPSTYKVPAKFDQLCSLPRGHYKYWVRHLNEGSHMKVNVVWPTDAMLHFCLVTTSIEAYLKDSDHCEVKLQSRTHISFEHVTKHSGDHYFILESVSNYDAPITPAYRRATKSTSPPPSSLVPTTPFHLRSTKSIEVSEDRKDGANKALEMLESNVLMADRSVDDSGLQSKDDASFTPDMLPSGYKRDVQNVELKAAMVNDQPDFFIVKANVSFDLTLIQYDTNQAEDLFVGSFSKEFDFNRPEWLVLYNPSDSHIYSVTISVTRRIKELIVTVFGIEFVLISIITCCCYCRYSTVPMRKDSENGRFRTPNRKRRGRHNGNELSKSMEDDNEPLVPGENPWDLPVSPEAEARRARRLLNQSAPMSPSRSSYRSD